MNPHPAAASPHHDTERAGHANRTGPGRVLALAYGFFTLAAGARSGVQLATHPHRAPIPYLLSAAAAAIYLAATIAIVITERHPTNTHMRRSLTALCAVEVSGVTLVGITSLLRPAWFPDATVWSGFGRGYGYVPAALPLLALAWLHRAHHRPGDPAIPG